MIKDFLHFGEEMELIFLELCQTLLLDLQLMINLNLMLCRREIFTIQYYFTKDSIKKELNYYNIQ